MIEPKALQTMQRIIASQNWPASLMIASIFLSEAGSMFNDDGAAKSTTGEAYGFGWSVDTFFPYIFCPYINE